MTDGGKERQEDITDKLWRNRSGKDETKDRPSESIAPIDSTEATGSLN
jgi:hypothetical protein